MTDQKPCFPGCRSLQYNHGANYLHIPGCPNDKPAPCRFCGHTGCTLEWCECSACQNDLPMKPAPTSAPASVGVNPAVRDIHSPPNRLAICKQGVPGCSGDGSYAKPHDGSVHMAFNAPASVTPVHFGVGGCPPLCNIFSDGYRHEPPCVHAENPPRTIINVSVTPASDEDVSEWKQWGGEFTRLCARIEQEKAANAELRAEGQKLKTAIDDLKRVVTEASMRRHEEITTLRARLAEVSKAAMAVVSNSDMATPPTIAAMAALEAILAKGDGK